MKVAVLLAIVFFSVPGAAADGQRGILFITSVDPDQAGTSALIDEARSEIQDENRQVHFDIEYLDPYLFTKAGRMQAKAAAFMEIKYAHQSIDVIITIGPEALDFAEGYGRRLFPSAKIVCFCSWLPNSPGAPVLQPGVTGVRLEPNYSRTADLALLQNPGMRELVLVTGASWDDEMKAQIAEAELKASRRDLNVRTLKAASMQQITSELSNLNSDSVVLFLDITVDGTGQEYISDRILPELSRAANRPMYGSSRDQVGKGAVGGSVVDMKEAGRALGKVAERLVKGESSAKVPFVAAEFQHYVFDARQLNRWGIDPVPEGSTVLYQEFGLWDLYKWKLIGLLAAVIVEAVLIVLLFRMTVQRRRAEREQARLLTMEKLESSLAAALLQLPAGMESAAIDRGFKHFIEFFGIDCISLFELNQKTLQFQMMHYRSAPNTSLRMSRLRPEEFRWTTDRLLRGEAVIIRTRADVPQEAAEVVSALAHSGIHSFAGVPLKSATRVFGALFFSSSKPLGWDAQLLEEMCTIANIIGTGLERARALRDLARSEQLNSAILASLPSLVAVLDLKGNIVSLNSPEEDLSADVSLGELPLRTGLNYLQICRRAAENGSSDAREVLTGLELVRSAQRNRFEMEYLSPNGGLERWFYMSAVPLVGASGGIVISHVDITERKLADLEVRESERRFRLMADSAPMMIWMSGPDMLHSNFNKSWLDFTGRAVEEELGDGWMGGIHPEDLSRYLSAYYGAADARRPFCVEYRLRRADGEYRWLVDRGVPRFKDDGVFAGFIGCCIDVTEQKETERARAEIGGRLIQAQEEERARIARELHDDINQKLGLLAIDIQQLQQRTAGLAPDAQRSISGLFDRANKISSDVQRLSHRLHSSRLDYLGLPAALRRLCEEFKAQHQITIQCLIQDVPTTVPRETNLCLFRIAQECLNNTAKHSGAAGVTVELQCEGGFIRLDVTDDGKGFESKPAEDREPGLGMISMRERLRLVQGDLAIESQPGKGTHISAVVPLKVPASAREREEQEFRTAV